MGLFSKGQRNRAIQGERAAQEQLPLPGLAGFASAHGWQSAAPDDGFTRQVLGTVSGLLMNRDDWVFQVTGEQVMCVCSAPFTSADDVLQRLQVLDQFVAAIPAQDGLYNRIPGFPAFPDGTPLDPARPEETEAKLAALSQEQRDQVLRQVQAYKANLRRRR